jgi:ATP-dependent DNA helicase RecG
MKSKLPINLEALLRQRTVEGARIEYKAGWNPDPIIRTLCAFANDFENLGGGYVIIGQDCDESGQPVFPPVGLPDNQLDKIQQELLGCCNLIQPSYFPILSVEEYAGKKLIVLWAPGGQNRPYKAPHAVTAKHKSHHYYIRRYASTIEAKGEDERELLSLSANIPFDDRYNQRAKVEDLSRELMQEYLIQVDSDLARQAPRLSLIELGRQMGVIGGPDESPFPINVGLMMFNPEPWRFFPVMQIDVVWFPKEGPGGNKFSEKIFNGPLPRMTSDALDYIKRNFISETVIKHRDRAEATRVENIPFRAIEEAVVNAVYHRGYDVREPIEIRIMHDELVVLSYPGPDRSVRLDQLRVGKAMPRRYRNRRIGEFLKELKFTEGRATGIPKIMEAMVNNGSPVADFEFDEDRSYFMVRLPVHPAALEVAEISGGDESRSESPTQSPTQLPTQLPTQSDGPLVRLLFALKDEEYSSGSLRQILGIKHRPTFRDNYLHPALQQGLIEYTIPDKPQSSNQRYRLTDKGRQLLTDHEGTE